MFLVGTVAAEQQRAIDGSYSQQPQASTPCDRQLVADNDVKLPDNDESYRQQIVSTLDRQSPALRGLPEQARNRDSGAKNGATSQPDHGKCVRAGGALLLPGLRYWALACGGWVGGVFPLDQRLASCAPEVGGGCEGGGTFLRAAPLARYLAVPRHGGRERGGPRRWDPEAASGRVPVRGPEWQQALVNRGGCTVRRAISGGAQCAHSAVPGPRG